MKISKKLRPQILDAVAEGTMETYGEHVHDFSNRPPELWDDQEKKQFGAITDAEANVVKRLEGLFASVAAPKQARKKP